MVESYYALCLKKTSCPLIFRCLCLGTNPNLLSTGEAIAARMVFIHALQIKGCALMQAPLISTVKMPLLRPVCFKISSIVLILDLLVITDFQV